MWIVENPITDIRLNSDLTHLALNGRENFIRFGGKNINLNTIVVDGYNGYVYNEIKTLCKCNTLSLLVRLAKRRALGKTFIYFGC